MLLVLCVVAVATNHATGDEAVPVKPSDQTAKIKQVLAKQRDAWNQGNVDGFMEYYWKSDDLTFSSGGKTTRGWKATKAGYKKRYATREMMGTLDFDELEVSLLGEEAALVLGRWHLKRDVDSLGGNFSLVFRRVEGQWLIIHDHTSLSKEPAA